MGQATMEGRMMMCNTPADFTLGNYPIDKDRSFNMLIRDLGHANTLAKRLEHITGELQLLSKTPLDGIGFWSVLPRDSKMADAIQVAVVGEMRRRQSEIVVELHGLGVDLVPQWNSFGPQGG